MSNTETPPRSIKQRIKDGDKISHNKVPTNASREQVHEFVAEHTPDMIYLDAHHSPITEWDISRICPAGQEKDTPVMMRIKHANPASLCSVSSSKHSRGCSMLFTWPNQASTMLIL